jgi:MYXO-CTERM domain-containing protein
MVCSGGAAVDAGASTGTGGAASSGSGGSSAGVSADGGADKPAMEPGAGQAPASADAGQPGDADFAAPLPQPPFECHAEPTQLKYCKPLDKECKTDQDCPTLFSCVTPTFDLPVAPMCVAPADGDAGTCGSYDAGAPTMVARSYCSPRYGEPAVDGASPQSPSTATSGGGSAGKSGGVIPPRGHEASDAGIPAEGENADDSNHVEACSVATPGASEGSPTWLATLFSLAAAWVVSRRRR